MLLTGPLQLKLKHSLFLRFIFVICCLLEGITSLKAQVNIVRIEYYVDADPGPGKANQVSITPSSNLANINIPVNTGTLSQGVHRLYVRGLDAAGKWSMTNTLLFYKPYSDSASIPSLKGPSNITRAEYFVDTDPGAGRANAIVITPGVDISNAVISLNPAQFTDGVHRLYVRARNAEGWSLTNTLLFYKPYATDLPPAIKPASKIDRVEYFIDQDPGYGNAATLNINSSVSIDNAIIPVNPDSLRDGVHRLYVRSRNTDGNWSMTNTLLFYKPYASGSVPSAPSVSDLTVVEYYIDKDPGYGKGVSLPVVASEVKDLILSVDISGLPIGNYTLYVRAKNKNGSWSMVSSMPFKVDAVIQRSFTIGDLPSHLCAGEMLRVPVQVNKAFGSNNVFTVQLSDGYGSFTNAVNIGVLKAAKSDTILATIPGNIATGTSYRVRVIASTPFDTTNGTSSINISRKPEPIFVIKGDDRVCTSTQQYSIDPLDSSITYRWQLQGGGILDTGFKKGVASVSWQTKGSYQLSVIPSNGCGIGTSTIKNVRVFKGVPTGSPVISIVGRLLTASGGSVDEVDTYQWYRNKVVIVGATGSNYTAIADGIYTVAFANPCGIGAESAAVVISGRQPQQIVFNSIGDKTLDDKPFVLSAFSNSGLKVTFKLLSGPATISGDTVSLKDTGIVVVLAQQFGDNVFDTASSVKQSFRVFGASAKPDLIVQNVTIPRSLLNANDTLTVFWTVGNIGNASSLISWNERIYIQGLKGENKTLVQQTYYTESETIKSGGKIKRSAVVTFPENNLVGDSGVFVVELVPSDSINEPQNATANNTGVQQKNWVLKKQLLAQLSSNEITEGAPDNLQLTITRSGSQLNPLLLNIRSQNTQRLRMPSTATIAAGDGGVIVQITAPDNSVAERALNDTLLISAKGFDDIKVVIKVLDNDQPKLLITGLPKSISEGQTLRFVVNTELQSQNPLEVFLTSSNQARLPLPSSVTIPAGSLSTTFFVTLPQDSIPEVSTAVNIAAGASDHQPATTSIEVTDDDLPGLEMVLSTDVVSETAGFYALKAKLRRKPGANQSAFTANISADRDQTLILPKNISLGVEEVEKSFDIGVIDNSSVDGDKQVIVSAAVVVASCGCTAPPSSAGTVSAKLTVTDDDGPALALSTPVLTVAEGRNGIDSLLLSRNTSSAQPLVVKLISSNTREATVPSSVTIPAGKSSVKVPFVTLSDGVVDGNQQVYFHASADKFSTASIWIIVSDENKPDFQISSAEVSNKSLQASSLYNYQVRIKNSGFATASKGVIVRGYLSKDDFIDDGDSLVTEDVIASPIAAGDSITILNVAKAPYRPGNYKLLFEVNPDYSLSELLTVNNFSIPIELNILPSYNVTAVVDALYYQQGVPVPISGLATAASGLPAKTVPVEVSVVAEGGFRRTLYATTDPNGKYSLLFTPTAKESGHYQVGASVPGLNSTNTSADFDILGLQINDGELPRFLTVLGDTLRGNLKIKNLTQKDIHHLSLESINIPSRVVLSFDTLAIVKAGSTELLPFYMIGKEISDGFNFLPGSFTVTAKEGRIQSSELFYFCQSPNGQIEADISKIEINVSPAGVERTVQVKLVNKGVGPSGGIIVSVPDVSFLTSISANTLPSINPGDTVSVLLKFKATDDVPFNYAINGSIGIMAKNGNDLSIPFTFKKSSSANGYIKALITDQFTYYADAAPRVRNAHVLFQDYFSSKILAEGYSDSGGIFISGPLPEGAVKVIVEKEKHLNYSGVINVQAGDTTVSTIFLNYQAITFTWNVVPTAIQDNYDITLTTQFETHVPMPVVLVTSPASLPKLSGSEQFAFNVTLTNKGLITAKDVTLNLPKDDPEYEFLTNYIPADLGAEQSVQVPVIMQRKNSLRAEYASASSATIAGISNFLRMNTSSVSTFASQALPCKDFVGVVYWYKCGRSGLWEVGGTLFSYEGRLCVGTGSGSGSISGIGGVGGGSGGGGWVYPPCANCPVPADGSQIDEIPVVTSKHSCVECIIQIIKAIANCSGTPTGKLISNVIGDSRAVLCILDAYKANKPREVAKCALEYAFKKEILNEIIPSCYTDVLKVGKICAGTSSASKMLLQTSSAIRLLAETKQPPLGEAYKQIFDDLQVVEDAINADSALSAVLFGNLPWLDSWVALYPLLQPYTRDFMPINDSVKAVILKKMQGYEFDVLEFNRFFGRYNSTIKAYALGVYVPNETFKDIIDLNVLNLNAEELVRTQEYCQQKGVQSVTELYSSARKSLDELIENQNQAVCASVTVELKQRLTMTREAFEGTLGIFNGHPTDAMDSLSVNIRILDEQGVPSNGLFEIQTKALTNVNNITGTGKVGSQQKASVLFLFIPEIGAAPKSSKTYSFGGTIRYWDPYAQAMVTLPLSPVTLTVNPSPNLMLHYFMQRNILGDDPLTSPVIEPSIPAELAVMVENQGYGPAVNMTISSAQPKVIENEKGLAIDFKLIGSNFQGEPKMLGVTDINFGTIPPLQSRLGEWYFTSSLLGKFVSYEASVAHANSFGNPDLSLVKGVKLHELTHTIREYGRLADSMNDFLVNDIFDVRDVPDIIYFSQGRRTSNVFKADTGYFSAFVSGDLLSNQLTAKASKVGWNYLQLPDPSNGRYELVSVTRSDGQQIPLNNSWLTFVTLPLSRPPVYENNFHFIDTFSTLKPLTYKVVWRAKDLVVPEVELITGAPNTVSNVQVSKLHVRFNIPVDSSSFGFEDLDLGFQGGPNLSDSTVIIKRINDREFDLDLSTLTTGNGFYSLTVQAAGVASMKGTYGQTGKRVTWSQFLTVPTVEAFLGLPAQHLASSIDTMMVLFNLVVDSSSVTPARFRILKNGVVQKGIVKIDSIRAGGRLYYISGLRSILNSDGNYDFIVDLPNIRSVGQKYGLKQQSTRIVIDNKPPVVVSLMPLHNGGIDSQHVTYVSIGFNEAVKNFNISSLRLERNGEILQFGIDKLSSRDLKNWMTGSFGMLTYPEGKYTFTVKYGQFSDALGNKGKDSAVISWIVNRSQQVVIRKLSITPDLGYFNNDLVTSGERFNLEFDLSDDVAWMNIFQTDLSGEQLLVHTGEHNKGKVVMPIVPVIGGNTGIRVEVAGKSGAKGNAVLKFVIDQTALTATWGALYQEPVNRQPDSIPLRLSAKLLDNKSVLRGINITLNGHNISHQILGLSAISDTALLVKGFNAVTAGRPGHYELYLILDSLQKYSSGLKGSGNITISWDVLKSNVPPVANAGKDLIVTKTGAVTLDGSGSYDADRDSISYRWVGWDAVRLSDTTAVKPSFIITTDDNKKNYQFLLLVSDGQSYSTDLVNVRVDIPDVPISFTGLKGAYCINEGGSVLRGEPAGGIFSGPGIKDSLFVPALAGSGMHTITYTLGSNKFSQSTSVTDLPRVTLDSFKTVCTKDGKIILTGGLPAGGHYSGPGVVNGIFDPAAVKPGSYLITYKYTNAAGCSDSAGRLLTVKDCSTCNATIAINGKPTFCAGDSVILTASKGAYYVWSPEGQTTRSITVKKSGSYSVTITDVQGCKAIAEPVDVKVLSLPARPQISVYGNTTLCQGDSTQLTSTEAAQYRWYPGGEATRKITVVRSAAYSVSIKDSAGCGSLPSDEVQIIVNSKPIVSLRTVEKVCADQAAFKLTGGAPEGGIYFGKGVKDNYFDPAIVGPGNTTIFYAYRSSQGCADTAKAVISVLAAGQCAGYCESKGITGNVYIARVRFNGIDNSSVWTKGYGNYTAMSTDVYKKMQYRIAITTGKRQGYQDKAFVHVWIDWNQDGQFDDLTEMSLVPIASISENMTGGSGVTGVITVPSNAKSGKTRMRVSIQSKLSPLSCGAITDGEVEDYTVVVHGATLPTNPHYFREANPVPGDSITHEQIAGGDKISPQFLLYPVPVVNELTIVEMLDGKMVKAGKKIEMQIFDGNGSLVLKKTLQSSAEKVDVSRLQNGLYVVKLKTQDASGVYKIIVQR